MGFSFPTCQMKVVDYKSSSVPSFIDSMNASMPISDCKWETALSGINSVWVPILYIWKKNFIIWINTWAVSQLRRASLLPCTRSQSDTSNFTVCKHLIPIPSDFMDLSYFSKGDKKWPQTRNRIKNHRSMELQLERKPEERNVHLRFFSGAAKSWFMLVIKVWAPVEARADQLRILHRIF